MTLFLDSATIDDAVHAAEFGFVAGITTNPTLIARVLNSEPRAGSILIKTRQDLVCAICDVFSGTVMVQLTGLTAAERKAEGEKLVQLRKGQIGLKIPSTSENFPIARYFAAEGVTVGMTTIFSPGQVFLACEAGVKIVFPYVNRSTRLLGDGLALVRQMRGVINNLQSPVQILAASIKTPEEAYNTILAGAHGLTLPMDIMIAMGENSFSQQAIEEFAKI